MASFFKFSCTIYWLGWFYYIGYMLGTRVYINRFIFKTPEVLTAENFIISVCLFNVILSFFGCCFVKCDVENTYCALGFVLPIIIINSTLTHYGVRAVRAASASFPDVPTYLKTYQYDIPLTRVQKASDCCGYWGFWDYATIFAQNSKVQSGNMSDYVPEACCRDRAEECLQFVDIPPVNRTAATGFTILELAQRSRCPFPSEDMKLLLPFYNTSAIRNVTYHLNQSIEVLVHTCGCHRPLLSGHASVYDYAHLVFYIVNGVTVTLYIVVYVRTWCIVKFDDGSSDHTLDEDSLTSELRRSPVPPQAWSDLEKRPVFRDSLPDLPFPFPPPPVPPQEPNTRDISPPREE